MRQLTVIASLAFSVQLAGTAVAADPTQVRQSLSEFVKDVGKLTSLIRGIREMKRRNGAPTNSAEYRTSWEYWANIHGYPGPTSRFGTVEQVRKNREQRFPNDAPLYAGFYAGLKDFTPPDKLAEEVWATCEHGNQSGPAIHFLSWHRMYLYFFERVLREASQDPTFALPYWDYTNNKTSENAAERPWAIPSIFGQETLDTPNGPISNPLYEKRRTAGFADRVQLDVNNELTDVDALLKEEVFAKFSGDLETSTHGFIHCTVGNGCLAPYIGVVPFAGNDPIFWLHHANIDRLWDCWTVRHGREANPVGDDNWMRKSYAFVNEKGERDEMKVAELFDPKGRIDYKYDNTDKCFRKDPEPVAAVIAMRETVRKSGGRISNTQISKASNVAVDKIDHNVSLVQSQDKRAKDAVLFSAKPNVLQPSKVILKLQGVQINNDPGGSVAIYLVEPTSKRRKFVGVLGFFGWLDHPSDHGHGRAGAAAVGRNFTFDVTTQFQELLAAQPGSANVQVALVASTGLVGRAPQINQARFRSASLRIQEVSIEVESASVVLDIK